MKYVSMVADSQAARLYQLKTLTKQTTDLNFTLIYGETSEYYV